MFWSPLGTQISVHVTDDGEIVGTKVTGDPNVPSGEVTFKARKAEPGSTKMVLPTSDIVTGCYPGKGRVAQEGFKQAKWVDGVLLSIDRAQVRWWSSCRESGRNQAASPRVAHTQP
jgi:hypothetical protein